MKTCKTILLMAVGAMLHIAVNGQPGTVLFEHKLAEGSAAVTAAGDYMSESEGVGDLSIEGVESSFSAVLWNKLGSVSEIQNSEVGEDGYFTHSLSNYAFEPGQHGNGFVRTAEAGEPLVKFPGSVLHNLSQRGSIELWINPKVPNPVPFSYGVFGLIGAPAGAYWDRGNVYLAWGDGTTGRGIYGGIYFGGGSGMHVSTPHEPTQFVATPGVPFHVAISWDINGIEGGPDKVQVYRDGVIVGSSSASWDPNGTALQERFRLGYGPDGGGFDKFISDNIKVWNFAKTDFSDRFTEGLSGDPICQVPTNPTSTINSATSVELSWDVNASAAAYLIQGRKVGAPNFVNRTSTTNSFTVNHDFEIGATYEWRVAAYCGPDTSDFTALKTFIIDVNCSSPTEDIVAWYPGEGTAGDVIDEVDGNLMNGTSFSLGRVGQAFELDGIDDYVNLDPLATTMAGESTFSIEMWVKADLTAQYPEPYHYTFLGINTATGSGSAGNVMLISMLPTGEIYLVAGASTTGPFVGDGEWHHIAVVKEGGQVELYLDGALEFTRSTSISLSGSDRWSIGQEWDATATSGFLNGVIDEVSIYSGALTATEVQEIYDASYNGKCTECINSKPEADSIIINEASACCEGAATVHISGGVPPYTYIWDDSHAQTSATATDLCPGDYVFTVSDANGCTETIQVTLAESAVPTPVNLNVLTVGSTTATLTWDSNPVVEKYRVFIQDSVTGSYLGGITPGNLFGFTGLTPSTTYKARVRSACGTVNSPFSDIIYFTTSTSRLAKDQFRIFPNPVSEVLYVLPNAETVVSVKLIDQLGTVVFTSEAILPQLEINVKDLARGVYFLQLHTDLGVEVIQVHIQ